jgi:DNA-binding XRE family transcriptional regulator
MPTDFDRFENELLTRPGVKKEFEALTPKYAVIRDLIQRRNELHLSQRDLAKMVGTRQPAISRLEAGDNNTRIETLIKVADALGLQFALTPKIHPSRTAARRS